MERIEKVKKIVKEIRTLTSDQVNDFLSALEAVKQPEIKLNPCKMCGKVPNHLNKQIKYTGFGKLLIEVMCPQCQAIYGFNPDITHRPADTQENAQDLWNSHNTDEANITPTIDGEEVDPVETKEWPQEGYKVFILTTVDYAKYMWLNNPEDREALRRGLILQTEEEAKREDDRRLLIKELKDFAGDQSWIDWEDSNQTKFHITYSYFSKQYVIDSFRRNKVLGIICYFQTYEHAQKAIEHFGERLDLLR
jgi:hypothetical protein